MNTSDEHIDRTKFIAAGAILLFICGVTLSFLLLFDVEHTGPEYTWENDTLYVWNTNTGNNTTACLDRVAGVAREQVDDPNTTIIDDVYANNESCGMALIPEPAENETDTGSSGTSA